MTSTPTRPTAARPPTGSTCAPWSPARSPRYGWKARCACWSASAPGSENASGGLVAVQPEPPGVGLPGEELLVAARVGAQDVQRPVRPADGLLRGAARQDRHRLRHVVRQRARLGAGRGGERAALREMAAEAVGPRVLGQPPQLVGLRPARVGGAAAATGP